MIGWIHIALIAAFSLLILVLLFLLIFQRFLHPQTRLQALNLHTKVCNNLDISSPYFFSWADHPCLVAEAVENGWPRFCFQVSSEGCSSDYMHKVRLIKKTNMNVIRTALPLPGPRFGNSFFPQQTYFEISITRNEIELCENQSILLSVGLTGGGSHLPLKSPGSFPGSIAFNSTGSVSLNGIKLVLECEKYEWGSREENVIGCGYNPRHKRVFFTLNSQLVHVIHCQTQEFGHPLFPTIAANTDVTLVLNLGQTPFRFEPGNSRRTPNPCVMQEDYWSVGFEDTRELFSLGKMDCLWQQWAATNNKVTESDQETDLFEIHLAHDSSI